MTFEDTIREVGFGRFQTKLMVLCGLGWAADAIEALLTSFVMPAVGKKWHLHASQLGLLGTAMFLGMLGRALVWGRVSDLMGRKIGFISTMAIDSVFGLLSAFSPSFTWLIILRTLTGFGVGAHCRSITASSPNICRRRSAGATWCCWKRSGRWARWRPPDWPG